MLLMNNLLYLYFRKLLTMTVQLLMPFPSLLLENENLVAFHVRKDLYHHFGPVNQRSTHGYLFPIIHQHHLLELELAAQFGVYPVDK